MKQIKFIITVASALISLLMPLSATAQTDSASQTDAQQGLEVQGLSINPFIIEIDAAPGDTVTRKIALDNTTNEPLNFIASINDFVPNGTTGQPLFLGTNIDSDPKFSLSRWVAITKQPQFTIPPLGQTEVEFTISIPADVEPGTHYGGILFGRPPGEPDATGSSVQHKAGAIILVRLGRSQESIEVEKFSADKKVYWKGPINFTTLLSNLGNVHAKPKGDITLKNIVGGQITQLPINRDASIVLPESKREFTAIWNPKFAFGRYVAEEVIYYGNPKLELRVSTVIWVIPIMQLAVGLAALIILIIVIRVLMRAYNRMIISRSKRE